MCVLYVTFGSKVGPEPLVPCHGYCSVVYFEVQIVLIFCRV